MRSAIQLTLVVLFALLWSLAIGRGQAAKNHPTQRARTSSSAGNAFFTQSNLTLVRVELGAGEHQRLSLFPRQYVPGRVWINGRSFTQVGIRLKGTGTFQPLSKHPNLALKFDWQRADQDLDGLTKIYLNNSRQDPTLLCDFIASGVFAEAGLPAPRITHARVQLNGRDLGLCVVSEAVNKAFLRRHFQNSEGNLYEGAFRDIGARLDQDHGDPEDLAGLTALRTAAVQADRLERLECLAKVLDLERFLDFMAVEMIVANWDGYAVYQNNYRLYLDGLAGRVTFIPHGMDNALFESGLSIMPPRKSVLAAALLEAPEDREAYRERVARLLPRVLDPERIAVRLGQATARMIQGAAPSEAESILRKAALLEQRVRERVQNVRAQLAGARPPTPAFDHDGIAKLEGWVPKQDWNSSPVEKTEVDGRVVLAVRATNGFCFGSWRLPAWLPSGRYRLEGLAATLGVNGLPSMTGSGAGVRVLGSMRGGGLDGSRQWTRVQHEFSVKDGCEWVELIAELRAFTGSAQFDLETLRLVRIDSAGAPPRSALDARIRLLEEGTR